MSDTSGSTGVGVAVGAGDGVGVYVGTGVGVGVGFLVGRGVGVTLAGLRCIPGSGALCPQPVKRRTIIRNKLMSAFLLVFNIISPFLK